MCSYPMPSPFGTWQETWDEEYGNTYNEKPLLRSMTVLGANATASDALALLNMSTVYPPIALTALARYQPTKFSGVDFYVCSMNLCLDWMNTSVQNGSTTAQILRTTSLSGVDLPPVYPTYPTDLSALAHQSAYNATLSFDESSDEVETSTTKLDVALDVWLGLQSSLTSYFNGTYANQDSTVYNLAKAPPAADEILDGIMRTSNVTAMMERAAASLTKQMRQNSPSLVSGKIGTQETYVLIRWAWLLLPVLVVVGSAAFLLTAIIVTHSRGTEVWKTSCLPLLYNVRKFKLPRGIDRTMLSEMGKSADITEVTLERSAGDAWALRQTSAAQQMC